MMVRCDPTDNTGEYQAWRQLTAVLLRRGGEAEALLAPVKDDVVQYLECMEVPSMHGYQARHNVDQQCVDGTV